MSVPCVVPYPAETAAPADHHILFIMDRLPRMMGGAEGVLLNIIRLLPREKYRCSLLTFDVEPGSPLENPGCPVHIFRMKKTYNMTAARMAVRLARLIRSERVDIVHTFFESSDIWGGFVTRMFTSARLVSSRRDMGILRSAKHRWAYRMFSFLPDRVVAVSEQVGRFCMAADRISPEKVVIVYNGVELPSRGDPLRRRMRRSQFGVPHDSRIVTAVANVRRVKGLDLLLRAFAVAEGANPRAHLWIVGGVLEKDYFSELQELAQQLGISGRVRFMGEHRNVRPLLELSDVFVLPSRSEGFSNALLEAMACELPCVATRVGGNGEAIQDSFNGLIVEPEDFIQMASAISFLLGDPERAAEMGEAARRTVELRFTPDRMMKELVKVYEGLPVRGVGRNS